MWVLIFNGHNQLLLTQEKKITFQEYASHWGLDFLTFPEDCTCSGVDNTPSDDDSIDSTSDDKEICSDPDESNDQAMPEYFLADIVDPSLPKIRCCKVKLGPWF